MHRIARLPAACLGLLIACTAAAQESALESLTRQVEDTERAFAKTMADRDLEAFESFLAEETVFFSGQTPLRPVSLHICTGIYSGRVRERTGRMRFRKVKVDGALLMISTESLNHALYRYRKTLLVRLSAAEMQRHGSQILRR